MNDNLLVLSRSGPLLDELLRQLSGERQVIGCDSLETLREQMPSSSSTEVLIHLTPEVLAGCSAGRFVNEMEEVLRAKAVYGLLDSTCPASLRAVAESATDECLEMPVDYVRLKTLLSTPCPLESEMDRLCSSLPHKQLTGRTRSLVTFTPEMFDMVDELKIAARHNVTCLLVGETGSGKSYLARLIHELSDRRDERFCTVACGALPADLIESELFGCVRGAFTGADVDREGKFAAAGSGTLLLDEIDVLPPDQQAKLLRVIETGEYEPVGSNETRVSKARLVVASNYDLENLVRNGTFRTDLYYRLNILNFFVPPLRMRRWDVDYLVYRFVLEHGQAHGVRLRRIAPEFLEAIRQYPWPGNVREMENVLRRAVLYCQRGTLSLADLPASIRTAVQGRSSRGVPTMSSFGNPSMPSPLPSRAPGSAMNGHGSTLPTNPLPSGAEALALHAATPAPQPPSASQPNVSQPSGPTSLDARVDQLERRIIEEALSRNQHRRKQTAAELGISRVTLYNKMKKHGLL